MLSFLILNPTLLHKIFLCAIIIPIRQIIYYFRSSHYFHRNRDMLGLKNFIFLFIVILCIVNVFSIKNSYICSRIFYSMSSIFINGVVFSCHLSKNYTSYYDSCQNSWLFKMKSLIGKPCTTHRQTDI